MANYKKGDMCRVISDSQNNFAVGSVVCVDEDDVRNPWCVQGSLRHPMLTRELELITEEPQYKKLTPKVGDKFRVVKDVPKPTNPLKQGLTIKVDNFFEDGEWSVEESPNVYRNEYLTTEYLEPVSEECKYKGQEMTAPIIPVQEGRVFKAGDIIGELNGKPIVISDASDAFNKQTLKQKAMNIYRKARMSKEEKVLHKAGFMNDDGTPTGTGTDALMFHLWSENKKALVEMAQEEIDEQEK